MSTDVYIPIELVVSNPGRFALKTDFNVSVEAAASEFKEDEPDMDYVYSALEPVTLIKFGARESWRYCTVMRDCTLHLTCSGEFRTWLFAWLEESGIAFEYFD